jgi:hypothetical protein
VLYSPIGDATALNSSLRLGLIARESADTPSENAEVLDANVREVSNTTVVVVVVVLDVVEVVDVVLVVVVVTGTPPLAAHWRAAIR